MMVRAVLFNAGDVRLGEVDVPEDCAIVNFGGCLFAKTTTAARLDGAGGIGVAFDQATVYVKSDLDLYAPRKVDRR